MTNNRFEITWKIMKEHDFEMDNVISKDLICSICKKVMIKAYSSPCQCRYCYECITKYLDEGNQFCPGQLPECQEEMININESIQIDYIINIRISKLIVKCPLQSCEYRDELRKMDDHIRTCSAQPVNCLYHNIGCRDMKSPGDKMKDHLVMENYAHTKYLVEWIDNVTNEMGSLRKYVGELQGEINNLKETDRHNQMEIVELTTNVKINEDEVKLLNEEMVALKNENRSMQQQINNLQGKDKKTQMQIVQLTTKSDEQDRQIGQWKDKSDQTKRVTDQKLQETSIRMEEMHQTKADLVSKFDQIILTIENVKEKSESLDVEICKIKTNLDIQNDGEFVWIIEDIRGKIKQAKDGVMTEIFSDPFYSHKHGYKMCLLLYPDGFDDDRGSHLGVLFCLMKGPFDDILSWPFKGDVTLSLMNQQSGLVHVSDTIEYDDDPEYIDVYMKPVNDRNIGWGYSQFISQNQLLSNESLVKNNQIIIKCSLTIR